MTDLTRLRAMYLFDRSLSDLDALRPLLRRAATAGITTLVTKAAAVTGPLVRLCHDHGLRVLGSVPCLSDHADPLDRPDLRPVDQHGGWARMEWYTGLIPTDAGYADDLTRRCARLAAEPGLDGLLLDFLRWPLHWELELRPGAVPRESSFDPTTLAAFTRATGERLPAARRAAVALLLGPLRTEWYAFRTRVITELAARLAAAIRAVRPDATVGMFLVPGDAGQRALVGQDVAALGEHVDGFLVMTYHGIVARPPSWIAATVADLAARTSRPVVPMVQTTADRRVARGADWGGPLDAGGFAAALARAPGPLCLFPAEGMDDPRWRLLATTLAADPRSL
ncbi:hypothetical protein [Micromonospora sp. NPDC050495]|uniref:hypothetical protein n=1 Tax=Micromonospora sp. NPDC050495 TaxID=3154936 RepID=UPI0033F91F18